MRGLGGAGDFLGRIELPAVHVALPVEAGVFAGEIELADGEAFGAPRMEVYWLRRVAGVAGFDERVGGPVGAECGAEPLIFEGGEDGLEAGEEAVGLVDFGAGLVVGAIGAAGVEGVGSLVGGGLEAAGVRSRIGRADRRRSLR